MYIPKNKPEMVNVPAMKFFMINGHGNPNNSEEFSKAVEALYSLSYGIKMLPKSGEMPEGYFDYTVYPLEGVWDLDEEGRQKESLDKDHLVFTLMIRQPDFVTENMAVKIIEKIKKKKPDLLLDKVEFGTIEEGPCIQMLHQGSYDTEPQSFSTMEQFCHEKGLRRKEKTHREIYLYDARKTPPEKQKTVLRFKYEI